MFDSTAGGTVPGEGAAAAVLWRLKGFSVSLLQYLGLGFWVLGLGV